MKHGKKLMKLWTYFYNCKMKKDRLKQNLCLEWFTENKPRKPAKSDSVKLKRNDKSEDTLDLDFDPGVKMHRTALNTASIREDEMSYLETARQQFFKLNYKYVVARVSLAIAIKKIEIDTIRNK